MAGQQWAQDVRTAFQSDAKLATRIVDAAERYQGELPALFWDIAKYVINDTTTAQTTSAKKRKLDDAIPSHHQPVANGSTQASIAQPALAFECKNVSFAVPARKKLKLQIIADQTEPSRRQVRLLNNTTNDTEYTLSNAQIDQVFCLPVPEKQQRQSNFVLLPKAGATNPDGTPCEQVVFTMNETKPDDANSSTRAKVEGDTYITVTHAELNALLQPYGKQVIRPTETEFASSIPQSHRKGEKGYHVKAHRGTKEGYLFFLPLGIIFGFKKPLSFFPFSSIESISYTSVLQRTFNLVIAATENESSEAKEIEFSMLDQADFAGIDEYIKRHQLNDASMAATRRAKEYNVNKDKEKKETNGGAAAAADAVGEDGLTELQRAEQQLQDDEDEEEEDYVESGGESDGEGEDSDEEDQEDEGHREE